MPLCPDASNALTVPPSAHKLSEEQTEVTMNKRKRVAWEKHRAKAKKLHDRKKAEKAAPAATAGGARAAAAAATPAAPSA